MLIAKRQFHGVSRIVSILLQLYAFRAVSVYSEACTKPDFLLFKRSKLAVNDYGSLSYSGELGEFIR